MITKAEDWRYFRVRGFILKRDFLPDADFKKMARELQCYKSRVQVFVEGATLTGRILIA